MANIDTHQQDRERRAQIEREYTERVKGQLFNPGKYNDSLTGLPNPQDKPRQRAAMNTWKINFK
jgi:hypothetical protein